jgi:excisionase family DNA binding protein
MKNAIPEGLSPTRARIPFMDRPTCSVAEACHAVGIGKTTLYDLMDRRVVASTRIGRRRLINVPSLLKLLGPPGNTTSSVDASLSDRPER